MRNQEYLLNHMAGIFHTGIFCLCEERLDFYEDNPEYNSIYNSHELRLALCDGADGQEEPIYDKGRFSYGLYRYKVGFCILHDGALKHAGYEPGGETPFLPFLRGG